jgi:hypothetical protein
LDYVGELDDLDINQLRNSFVVDCTGIEAFQYNGCEIKTQVRKYGFTSLAHVKMVHDIYLAAQESETKNALQRQKAMDLIKSNKTTLNHVIAAIIALASGRRIGSTVMHKRAIEVIDINQKKGTGNWFVFLELHKGAH